MLLPEFGNAPTNFKIAWPYRIFNSERIYIGDGVRLGPGSFLQPHREYPFGDDEKPRMETEKASI